MQETLTLVKIVGGLVLVASCTVHATAQFAGSGAPQESAQIDALQSDPDPAGRREAARVLGLRGSPAAVPALAQAAAFDPDRQVRVASGDAIALIRRRGAGVWIGKPPVGQNNQRALVESWYQLYLHRAADPAGMRDYLDRPSRGVGPLEVQAAFLGGDEYFRLYNGRPRVWIAALYRDVLDRSPSPAEIQNWMQSLSRSGGSREQTSLEFLRAAQAEIAQRNR
jgi:hypothetical protein